MENEIINEEQPAPVIEKISLKNIQQEKLNLDLESDTPLNNLVKSMLALSDEEVKKAIAYVEKKIEILKNGKK